MTEQAAARGRRKTRTGIVVSDKMQKTVVVELERRFTHRFYGKQITGSKRVAAHEEQGAHAGDTVRIVETRSCWSLRRASRGRREYSGRWGGSSGTRSS